MLNPLAPFKWPLSHVRQFAAALLYVVIIRLGLWIVPYKRLDNWLLNFKPKDTTSLSENKIRLKAEFVRLASRFVFDATCLTQALALRTILQRHGQSSDLKFGVDRDENQKLVAHAWIELNGKIIIGKNSEIRRYSVLAERGQTA
jgi:hypothetical protein